MTVQVEEETQVETPTAEPEKEAPKSLHDRLDSIIDQHISKAGAEETAAEETTATDGTQAKPADQSGSDGKPAEEPKTEPEKIEVTADQLADTKYWGTLDADGWQRMERDYPAETKLIKSAQAAASKIVNGARKTAAQPPELTTEQSTDKPSPELIAAVRMSQSLDEEEAAKGYLLIAKLTTPSILRENGIDPDRARASAAVDAAYRDALVELPELAGVDLALLDPLYKTNRTVRILMDIGTHEAIVEAFVFAGQIVLEQKTAAAKSEQLAQAKAVADAKKKETQRIVKSNANLASASAIKPHGATPDTRSTRERLGAVYDAHASVKALG